MELAEKIKERLPELDINGISDETIIRHTAIRNPEILQELVIEDIIKNQVDLEYGFNLGKLASNIGKTIGNIAHNTINLVSKATGVGSVLSGAGSLLKTGSEFLKKGKGQISVSASLGSQQSPGIPEKQTNIMPFILVGLGAVLLIFLLKK